MIKMKVSTKIDTRGLKKLQKQLQNTHVDVGWIDSPNHWMSDVPVAQVASSLHDWSPWRDSFMLSETRIKQVQSIVATELQKFGDVGFWNVLRNVGEKAKDQIEVNIRGVSSPPNSEAWAAVKGFNDPLIFGSRTGEEPNLISALTFKVGV